MSFARNKLPEYKLPEGWSQCKLGDLFTKQEMTELRRILRRKNAAELNAFLIKTQAELGE